MDTDELGEITPLAKPAPELVPPRMLIEAFCSGTRDKGTATVDGGEGRRGYCGYEGGEGNPLQVGFDDGYEFLGFLEERGWRPIFEKGDWPCVVYLWWPPQDGTGAAIVEYQERDFTIWTFSIGNTRRAQQHVATLRDQP